ncbi:MAG TPA: FAD-dependent oxidoreductase, partial [Pseudomonadales bacterium]|nr:FAD-dependent oxidoreductase [Pseudomonadales bacterium]
MYQFDLAIIGCGPTGEKAAAQAAYFGKSVVIFEKAPAPGGAGVQTGTLPSKTLREAAMYLSGYRNRELYGVAVELNPDATVSKLLARTDAIREGEAKRMIENLERHKVNYRNECAEIVDPHTVRGVGTGEEVTAEFILIATGSTPFHPPGVNFPSTEIHDTDEILSIEHLPKSLTIIGAGVIGCEYACMFSALGTRVTIIDKSPSVLTFLDREIVDRLRQSMERAGVTFMLQTDWQSIEETSEGIRTTVTDATGEHAVVNDELLFAA